MLVNLPSEPALLLDHFDHFLREIVDCVPEHIFAPRNTFEILDHDVRRRRARVAVDESDDVFQRNRAVMFDP